LFVCVECFQEELKDLLCENSRFQIDLQEKAKNTLYTKTQDFLSIEYSSLYIEFSSCLF